VFINKFNRYFRTVKIELIKKKVDSDG